MMLGCAGWAEWKHRWLGAVAVMAWLTCLCGCQTAQFYGQAIRGQCQVLTRREPIAQLLADPGTPLELREKFQLVLRLRAFARDELSLPVGSHYLTYADLGRRFAVWNVHAAPPFSLEPKTWWYPLVGRLKYRGYFREADARAYADWLARGGAEVFVEGVEAYSTLGWFADPLLNTFIHHGEADLAGILFHELAHQRLFLSGDTDFNEAFATVVAEEGVRRWFAANENGAAYQQYRRELGREREFVSLILHARHRLETLYRDGKDVWAMDSCQESGSASVRLEEEKAGILAELREDYGRLKERWGGYSGFDPWFAQPLNNAQLNTVAIYYQLVPGFEALLKEQGNDLDAFYTSVAALRGMSKADRARHLARLAGENGPG